MARLVVRRVAAFVLSHHHGAAFAPHHDLVLGVLEVAHLDDAAVAARGEERRFVDEVREVRAREARRAARDDRGVDVGADGDLAHVDVQNLLAAADVGKRHHDLTVEAARAQERRVEHVRTVRRGDHDDVRAGVEPVHFDEHLVQGLFAFVVAAAQAGAALTADRVDFVDEDDAGGVLLRRLEHVAHARRTDADEHFDEVGTRNREEGHARLARDRLGEKRLAGTRRTHEEDAARNAAAQALELHRVAQEVDDFLNVFLGFVAARDVLEADLVVLLAQHAGLGLAEAEGAAGAAATALHAAHEEDPHADQKQHREPGDEDRREERGFFRRLPVDLNAGLAQILHHPEVARTRDRVFRARLRRDRDRLALNVDAADLAGLGVFHELRVARRIRPRGGRHVELPEDGEEHHREEHPEGNACKGFVVQLMPPCLRGS